MGKAGASPDPESPRGFIFCFINGKLPAGARVCLPGEAFNASIQCSGAWEGKAILISILSLTGSVSRDTGQLLQPQFLTQ